MIDQVKKHNQIIYIEVEGEISKAEEYNNNILKKLRDPSTQKKYIEVFEQLAIKNQEDINEIRMLANFFYFLCLPIAFIMFFLSLSNIFNFFPEAKEDNLINLEKIQKSKSSQ